MPTPVTTARQCLTQESSVALDDAVAVARRRGHAQTSSLHMVSSLLSIPSSALREACSRTRNNAYSTRIQFKALELCLGASLDRLAASQERVDEPPVSNSLMAAIKRSQASQRRQPENFNFYQQQIQCGSSSSSAISVVKVELQNLILSILDDPVVSRVFGEAGFRSCDIKVAILRPVHRLFKYSRYKGPPMFLCNLSDENEVNKRGFSFPFLGFSGVVDGEENFKRIGGVMMAKNGRKNPLLLGVCGYDALKGFSEMVKKGRGGDILPMELTGMKIVSVENEILNCDENLVKLKFDEVYKMVENCNVVISLGDLKVFAGDDDDVSVDGLSCFVDELSDLLKKLSVKVWLICSAAKHEIFLKILNRFPSIENDWNLQILPITSIRSPSSIGESYPRSSLMESFVPFGGFFSMPSDVRSPVSSLYQSVSRCHLCNKKCEQEINAFSKGGLDASVADRYQSSLPLWLQMTRHIDQTDFDALQAKDDRMEPSSRIASLERKWDSICQRHHSSQLPPKATLGNTGSPIPSITGFQIVEDENKNLENDHENYTGAPKPGGPMDFLTKANTKCDEDEFGGHGSSLTVTNRHTSPSSVTSAATDLGLGNNSTSTNEKLEKRTHLDPLAHDIVCGSVSNHTAQSSSCSHPDIHRQFDLQDFKMLYASLSEKIGFQDEAVYIISQTIARRRSRNENGYGRNRGDIWLSVHGPDLLRKKKLALALSEILYGSVGNLISVDLGFHDEKIDTNALFGVHVFNKPDVTSRGRTVVDYIVEKLSKRPLSVVFLENIDDADLQVQNSLSQAIKTGRFSDSHGREVGIGNATFLITLRSMKGDKSLSSMDRAIYSEESVLKAKGWPIQMVIGYDLGDDTLGTNINEADSNIIFMNKRKLIGSSEMVEQCGISEIAKRAHKASNSYLDLNVPAEESELSNTLLENPGIDSIHENSREWLEGFHKQVDKVVFFKPFDFDSLAQKISVKIRECLNDTVDANCLVEIDKNVMEQILAAAYFADIKKIEEWVDNVVRIGVSEAREKYSLTDRSVVKLVLCVGTCGKQQQIPAAFLPDRILVN